MGGDKAPAEIVRGAALASGRIQGKILLTGDKMQILEILKDTTYNKEKIEVVHTTEIITNDDKPTAVIRQKKDSSMVVCFDLLKQGRADAMVSAGSTGALLAGSIHFLKRLSGISRPALAPFLPNGKNGFLIVDGGANTNTKPENLLQFAIMGSIYAEKVMGIKNPRVGLLNIGAEESKGNALSKSAFSLLSESGVNFVGNAEARDPLTGAVDVVVCDGFTGNVLLKAVEGTALMLFSDVKQMFMKNLQSKVAALLMKKGISGLKAKYDYKEYGGAPFLGVSSCVVKAHGTSDALSIAGAIKQASDFADSGALSDIASQITALKEMEGKNENQ